MPQYRRLDYSGYIGNDSVVVHSQIVGEWLGFLPCRGVLQRRALPSLCASPMLKANEEGLPK
jgi:hypothetical protein